MFFGGTDENPFLVELDRSVMSVVQRIPECGEDTFYQSLKPQRVKQLEGRLGVPAKRQGDIFAVPVGWTWEQLRTLAHLIDLTVIGGDGTKEETMQVFDTRHVLKGRWLEMVTYRVKYQVEYQRVEGTTTTLFTEGTLEAPDHSPLVLDGVYVLVQADFLARPREAD